VYFYSCAVWAASGQAHGGRSIAQESRVFPLYFFVPLTASALDMVGGIYDIRVRSMSTGVSLFVSGGGSRHENQLIPVAYDTLCTIYCAGRILKEISLEIPSHKSDMCTPSVQLSCQPPFIY